MNSFRLMLLAFACALESDADPGPATADPAGARGSVGLVTFSATAEFDDFLAYQP